MKVFRVLGVAVALFLVSPASPATLDTLDTTEDQPRPQPQPQEINQLTNGTETLPQPEAFIGGFFRTRPRPKPGPFVRPLIIPVTDLPLCQDPPLPHALYTHALDGIQRRKSVPLSPAEGGFLGEVMRDGPVGSLPHEAVQSMTAEESFTLLGYPYTRPQVPSRGRHQRAEGRGWPGGTRDPGQVRYHQAAQSPRQHPRPPTPALRSHHASSQSRYPPLCIPKPRPPAHPPKHRLPKPLPTPHPPKHRPAPHPPKHRPVPHPTKSRPSFHPTKSRPLSHPTKFRPSSHPPKSRQPKPRPLPHPVTHRPASHPPKYRQPNPRLPSHPPKRRPSSHLPRPQSPYQPEYQPPLYPPVHEPPFYQPDHEPSFYQPEHELSFYQPDHEPSFYQPDHEPSFYQPEPQPPSYPSSPRPPYRTRPPPTIPPDPRPRPRPRPKEKPKPTPTPHPHRPPTLTPDPLNLHNLAGPPYFNTAPPHLFDRKDKDSDVSSTTASSSSFGYEVWATPPDSWQLPSSSPTPATTTTTATTTKTATNNYPSLTATHNEDREDPWGSFGDADWLGNGDHGWHPDWPSDWSNKRQPGPQEARKPPSSHDVFPSVGGANDQGSAEDAENVVPDDRLLQTLLKNHRLPGQATPRPKHRLPHIPRPPYHYPAAAATPAPHALSEPPLSVSRYSEIPLTKDRPHKTRGGPFPGKHKHRPPPPPFVSHRDGPHGSNRPPLFPPRREQPTGVGVAPGGPHMDEHRPVLTEWPWQGDYAGMVPVATIRRPPHGPLHR